MTCWRWFEKTMERVVIAPAVWLPAKKNNVVMPVRGSRILLGHLLFCILASLLQSFGTLLVLEFYTRACSGRKFAFAAC